jgi:hypothetical protein
MTDTTNTEPFDYADPASWPDGSYAANERNLAYALTDDTMEWYNTMKGYGYERDEYGVDPTSWHLFNLLMMNEAAFLAMIDLNGNTTEAALELRQQVQDDANDGSGDFFTTAMNVRYAAWTQLKDLIAKVRTEFN